MAEFNITGIFANLSMFWVIPYMIYQLILKVKPDLGKDLNLLKNFIMAMIITLAVQQIGALVVAFVNLILGLVIMVFSIGLLMFTVFQRNKFLKKTISRNLIAVVLIALTALAPNLFNIFHVAVILFIIGLFGKKNKDNSKG